MTRGCVTRGLGSALAVARRVQLRYANSLTLSAGMSAGQQIHRFIPFSSTQEIGLTLRFLLVFLLRFTSSFRHDQNC